MLPIRVMSFLEKKFKKIISLYFLENIQYELSFSNKEKPQFILNIFAKNNSEVLTRMLRHIGLVFKDSVVINDNDTDIVFDISPSLFNKLLKKKHEKLSKMEETVLKYVCSGLTSKEISLLLDLSVKTIEVHRYNIFKKIDAKNSTEAILYALEEKNFSVPIAV